MASADTRMKKETECPLCMDVYKNPIVAGACIHSFCRDCLRRHIELNGSRSRFPCPLCRKDCALPRDGVDGLTANFTLANIIEIEKLRSKAPTHGQNLSCHVCTEGGDVTDFCHCAACDGIFLCRKCCKSHADNSMTDGHVLFGLCETHVKPQKKYCRTCHRFLCKVCLFSKHSDHDVIEASEIFEQSRVKLSETRNAGLAFRNEAVENVPQVEALHNENVEKWRLVENEIDRKYLSAKSHVTNRVATIDKEIEQLMKEKENLVFKEATLDKQNDSLQKEIKIEQTKSSEFLESAILKFQTTKNSVEQTLERAERHVTGTVLTSEKFLEINQTERELTELYSQSNASALFNLKGEFDRFPVFVSGTDMFDLGSLRWKRIDLQFLAEWPHDVIYGVVHVSEQQILAALVHCPAIDGAYGNAIFAWGSPTDAPELLTKDVDEGMYMTCSNGNLVIFRRKPPYIRVLDGTGQKVKDVAMEIGKRRSLKPWSGGVDKEEHFFLVDSTSSPRQLVVHNGGNKYKQTDFLYTRLTCCRQSETVFACDDQCIAQLKWSRGKMTSLRTGKHGVHTFRALDICCDGGSVYIVGVTQGDSEISVYRVTNGESDWIMERVDLYGENLKLRSESSHPRISVSRDQLVIAHDIGIAVFLLLGK